MDKGAELRADAVRFFEWCPFNLNRCVDELSYAARTQFEKGGIPEQLLERVRSAWADHLKTSLPWSEQFAAIRKALPNSEDYDAWMNCSLHLLPKLPKRLRAAVAKEQRKRAKEIHDTFFGKDGETRLVACLRIWRSQGQALNKLIIQALGCRCKKGGGASVGAVEIDIERRMLSEAEATGSAMRVSGLAMFLRSLWENNRKVMVKTTNGLEQRTIPNPYKSEARLNRFLINLGRALADTRRRRELPDWKHIDQTLRYVVHGWCEHITVDGEPWPRLCFLTTPALAEFLTLCRPQRWNRSQDPRSLERAVARLGLVRIPYGRIKHVEKWGGNFYFS